MEPLVSCVLATANRRSFLRQALRCFLRQSYPNRELVVVDDGAAPAEDLIPDDPRIRYLWLGRPTSLGVKLNCGVAASSGTVIQKLDDDDFYHADFLRTTVASLRGHDPARTVAACGCFLVLIASTGEVKFSGNGWFAGATLCFHRALWARHPFRDVTKGEDWFFLKDHCPRRIAIRKPELFMAVRHDRGHAWKQGGKGDVTAQFRRCPTYRKPLRALVPAGDLAFYESLMTARGRRRSTSPSSR